MIQCSLLSGLYSQTANPQQYKYVFTVAKDGSGDYTYVQDAIDAMRVYPLAPITLYIKNGVYNEKITLPATNTDVTFVGESVDKTIISFNDYSEGASWLPLLLIPRAFPAIASPPAILHLPTQQGR